MIIFLLLALSMLLIYLFVRFYRKNWSRNLEVSLKFSRSGLHEGENGWITETVTNKKLLPFWWGDLQYRIPDFIRVDKEEYHGNADYKDSVSAFSYEKLEKKVPFTALHRGYYHIRESELLTQDLFFKYRLIRRYPADTELYVYPGLRRAENFGINFKRITGEIVARRHAVEDPFAFRGIRDYSPFDSMKTVNWNATAKTGDLKVNQFNHTSSQEVLLLLDFDANSDWDTARLKEDTIRIAARLARDLIREGVPVGLVTNASDIENGEEIALPCRNGANHCEALFRQLARLDFSRLTRPFLKGLRDRVEHSGTSGAQLVLISFSCAPELQKWIQTATARGRGFEWIFLREQGAAPQELKAGCGLTVCEVK